MTAGEKRLAGRLEALLPDDALIWYDIPVGKRYRHPDFVIIHPTEGLIFLEVKDWRIATLLKADPQSVTLDTAKGQKTAINPVEQVRQYACATVNQLAKDPRLQQLSGTGKGRLDLAWAYGVVFTNITRRQLRDFCAWGETDTVFPEALTLCQDEMTESVLPEAFTRKLAGMFTTCFRSVVTPQKRDILRRHLFPEIAISQKNEESGIHRVMDIQQEILARNLGDGHRVIHGVAGSGKTLILLYRCLYLAENVTRPVLVLCFNITLANYLRECIADKGLSQKVHVHHFHGWCTSVVRQYKLAVNPDGAYSENSFTAFETAVSQGVITDTGYGAVLIDEGHDFDSRWLSLVARLFDNQSGSLLLMYDDAQSLYRRERALNFTLASVGIQAVGRTAILRTNYRNTRSILNFAYAFSRDYFDTHHNQELPLVDPEAYGEEGEPPELLRCASADDEARRVVAWLEEMYAQSGQWNGMAVLCPAQFSVQKITGQLENKGIPFTTCFEASQKKKYSHKANAVQLLTYQSSKGLEFPFVAVVNASFVHQGAEEKSAAIPALYVAFTRASKKLLVTWYRENSISLQLDRSAGR
ncbi:TPA: NERD domain-containing protein [Salmonella enterica]|nr:NERD domain-containing protein [Salmonella enterica]HCC3864060.1 NERD domain-containing protein [Salmonella enterica]HCC3879571.1 NERD domain-containing protein [Salmonella enterica]HCC3965094.1 NERD domain-containing protein [Salmonella enterica]HCC4014860.1 NERD domain-containing protein [Salmonella enterica]